MTTAPNRIKQRIAVLAAALLTAGCAAIGPQALLGTRLQYNEVIKTTNEEQLLLNIVRLRYTDTPSSLAISTIAAQFERAQAAGLTPFFTAAGGDNNRSYSLILPQAQVSSADRPTFSLTPLDDQEFTRKLFTPLPLEGLLYLTKTTWPISTVFRLYLENLNWVPNAQTASGPTPQEAPVYSDFRSGVDLLQRLQSRGLIVFGSEERSEALGSPLPASAISARDVIEAAKSGYEYRADEKGVTWTLYKKTLQPVLHISPAAIDTHEMGLVRRAFRLKPGLAKYDITQETLNPFPSTYPPGGLANIDLETRSLLQALYFVSHGVEIPPEHHARGLVVVTRDKLGQAFDWREVTSGLFRVRFSAERPLRAHAAVPYQGQWFYIDESDHETKATFTLLMQLARLELTGKAGAAPVLTLPLGGR
jgi:hypothetical protein